MTSLLYDPLLLQFAKILGSLSLGTAAFIYLCDRFSTDPLKTKPLPPLGEFIKELTSKAAEIENEYYEVVVKCQCDGECGWEDIAPIRDLIKGNIYRTILLVDELLYKQVKNTNEIPGFITYHYWETAYKWKPSEGKSFLDEFCDCILTENCLYLKKYNFVKAL
jgi:hypothetical protein